LVQIYLAARCYNYQTGEDHPEWAYSPPWATVKAIQFWAETNRYGRGWPIMKLKNSHGYDWAGIEDAGWEWTRDHGFPELQMIPGRLDNDEVRQAITATGQMRDQGSAPLGMSKVSLLARLVLAAYEDAPYLILESENGRFVRGTPFRETGEQTRKSAPRKLAMAPTQPAEKKSGHSLPPLIPARQTRHGQSSPAGMSCRCLKDLKRLTWKRHLLGHR
jgi:hypothetical protein